MEVISIADYDLAQETRRDVIPLSATYQLQALAKSGVNQIVHRFGEFTLGDEAHQLPFDFDPPTTCKLWPGLRYGNCSIHKEISKRPSSQQPRKHSQHDPKPSTRPRKSSKPPKKSRQPDEAPVTSGNVVSRDPPLHLLSLPAEIRNSIWSILAVSRGPIEAQLRQIQPCKKLSRRKGKVVRRFPSEPLISSVNHQLRREILSIFYGNNRFVFERNACAVFQKYGMLNPAIMQQWKPRQDLANFLTQMDLRFNALPRSDGMLSIVYRLRRSSDGIVTIIVKAEKSSSKKATEVSQYCLCAEEAVAEVAAQSQGRGDLMEVAVTLISQRTERLFSGLSIVKGNIIYPSHETCETCKRATFETVYSGI